MWMNMWVEYGFIHFFLVWALTKLLYIFCKSNSVMLVYFRKPLTFSDSNPLVFSLNCLCLNDTGCSDGILKQENCGKCNIIE